MSAPKLKLLAADFFERPVTLRLPFRFGVVTLREAPQLFVRARVKLADGREGDGVAAEMLAPKWFDKSPVLSNEDNFDQLRRSLALARRWLPSGLIAHVHLNDPNRRGPGEGTLAFGPILAALRACRYGGDAAIEPFVYQPDGPTCAARGIGYIRGLMQMVPS